MPSALVTKDNILDYFKKLKPTTSPGPDGLHPMFLKHTKYNNIRYPVQILFNRFLDGGFVPAENPAKSNPVCHN